MLQINCIVGCSFHVIDRLLETDFKQNDVQQNWFYCQLIDMNKN